MAVAVMRITEPICASQTLRLLPPQSTLVPKRSHRTQLKWRMSDWEKYAFTAQRKVRIEVATSKLLRSGAPTGKVQCCSAVRSTASAALRAVRRSIRSTAVYCGELYCVVDSRSGVNRTLSLRAFRFISARFFAKQFFPHGISEGSTIKQQYMLAILYYNGYTYL